MNSVQVLDVTETLSEPIPSAIFSLIEGAVTAFDADRDASRSYLLRARALLRARRVAGLHPPADRSMRGRGRLAAWQLNRVVDHIESHLAEKISARELAKLIDVSVGQLFRAFKVSVGIPPRLYITRRRVELACRFLKTTDEPLSQVAIACGLCDQSHFSRIFRRATGLSPSVWRRENAMGPAADTPLYVRSLPSIRTTP
jgi:AraC family transcriptional regulator